MIRTRYRKGGLALLGLVAVLAIAASLGRPIAGDGAAACPIDGFAAGDPPVDATHIFCGDINDRGRAVGFHSRPGGDTPATVSRIETVSPERGRPGIYTLRDFIITVDGEAAQKPISTMFPDSCSREDVLAAIRHAFRNATSHDGNRFDGPSGSRCTDDRGQPFPIRGYTSQRGGFHIRTAYPN
jgi:hypothetical protein